MATGTAVQIHYCHWLLSKWPAFFFFYTYMCTFCRSSELMTSKAEEENRDYTDISSNYGWRSVLNKELIVTPVSRRHETRLKRFPHWYNRDRGRRSRSFSTELCDSMQPFNKCTPDPAVGDGGEINKNASSTAWSRPASKHETVAFYF